MKIANYLVNNSEKGKILYMCSAKITDNLRDEKTAKKENKNINVNIYESIDEMIKSLQDRIETVKQNDKYDDKTKKYKIEKLQKQIDELNEFKAMKELEDVQEQIEKKKKKKDEKEEKAYTDKNEDGDTYLSEEDAKMLADSQISLDKISYYSKIKARMASEAYRLNSEMDIDGYSPVFKAGLSNKLTHGIARLEMSKSLFIGYLNNTARESNESKIDKDNETAGAEKADKVLEEAETKESEAKETTENAE